MTDRDPDDLYDALRDRLVNYGQEPPAPLWASIRAQLPQPVAAPKLRRRRAAWLGLLLLLIGIGSWQGWRLSRLGRNRPEVATGSRLPANEARIPINSQLATPQPAAAIAGTTASHAGTTGQATTAAPEATKAARAVTAAIAGRAPVVALEEPRTTIAAARSAAAAQRSRSIGKNTSQSSPADALANGALASTAPDAARTAGRSDGAGAPAPAVATGRPNTAVLEVRARKQPLYSTNTRAKKRRGASRSGVVVTTDQRIAILPSADLTKATKSTASGAVPTANHLSIDAPTAPISFAAWNRLQPRSIVLLPAPWATPTVPAPTNTLPRPAQAMASRWAVQVLAGPALTYRRLGSSGGSVAPTAPVNFYNQAGDRTSVAAQERPAAGFGAQVQVQRVLNGRWTLSTGLGYQEYATRLAFQTVPASAAAPNSFPMNSPPRIIDSTQIRSANLRDTYRFATVPMRVGYWLGRGGRHFRFGLLGGAAAAFYLGGATTEGSTCGCTSQSWGPTGSPYRPLNLSLSLGVDLRYRVGPRWELLAQPTGTYFLTPLARPASGFAPRYLLGGSTLLGISYRLR